MTDNEGYIKFQCEWKNQPFRFPEEVFNQINEWRQRLYNHELIGAYDDGIGFGNLSIREESSAYFIISGSATGNYSRLDKTHYSRVIGYDLNKNYVKCIGATKASSEALTHAAIYESTPLINAVIHTHNKHMWKEMLNQVPTTSPAAEFGTPDIAFEIKRLFNSNKTMEKQIIVMGGHEDGIITFGKDLQEAGNILLYNFRISCLS